ncbi:unnamed protein product [Tilletia controversa]|nr:hypothetical protein CF336_g7813 [Tilletia laevis]KAE8185781.1 hypothetical protein CF328_g7435 [Tilletia controversa]KAE8246534.1 hypothetical protein A4X03_0g7249 [Tilletia caries]CAD6885609.1 unnamed protein product [Tilletia caries]CAD6911294.1 unnamed protein product [Tilletia controversa]
MSASNSSTGQAQAQAQATSTAAPPLAVLRVQILAARNLAAMDRNGLADPFVTVSFLGGALPPPPANSQASAKQAAVVSYSSQRRATSVVNKSLNPAWSPAEATFDLPILPEWLGLDDSNSGAAASATPATAAAARQRNRSARLASAAFAPLRLTAKGAAAGARAVRSRTPRPIIIGPNNFRRKRNNNNKQQQQQEQQQQQQQELEKDGGQLELVPSRGSIALARSPAAALKAGIVSGIELVVWDKDKYTKNDYMGEVSVPVEAWAPALAVSRLLGSGFSPSSSGSDASRPASESIAWADAQPFWTPLRSTRLNTKKKVTGELQLKIGLVAVPNASVEREPSASETIALPTLADVYQALLLARLETDNASVRAVPADQSVGTAPASDPFVDDGLSSGEDTDDELEELESEDDEDEEEDSDDEDDDEDEDSGSDSGSEESYYETENEGEAGAANEAEDDFYRTLGVVPSPRTGSEAKEAAAMNQAAILPSAKIPPTAAEPGPLAASPSTTTTTSSSTSSTANLPVPATGTGTASRPTMTRPESKSRLSFRFLARPKMSSSSSSSSVSGSTSTATGLNSSDSGATGDLSGLAVPPPPSAPRRRIRRIRKKNRVAAAEGEDGKTTRSKKAGGKAKLKKKKSKTGAGGRAGRIRGKMQREYSFKAEAGLDIIGIVMLEVKEARNLPRWKGMIGGFDMDPFAVISFGQKIYRTRVCRHTLNPVWDEKLLFHVRRYEDKFQIKAAIYDWDRISSHDYCGGASLNVADLVAKAPTPDPVTGLYASDLDFDQELGTFELPLEGVPDRDATTPGAGGGNGLALTADTIMSKLHLGSKPPAITLRAKFQPYAALRQRFWRQLLKQFDSDESGTLNFLEISSMLDSLGATLTRETIVGWFEGRGKDVDGAGGGLTFDEAIAALEGEMRKPEREKKKVAAPALSISTGGGGGESGAQTPALSDALSSTSVGGLDVEGIQAPSAADRGKGTDDKPIVVPKMSIDPPTPIDGSYAPKLGSGAEPKKTATGTGTDPVIGGHGRKLERGDSNMSASSVMSGGFTGSSEGENEEVRERVITLKECPLCHRPRLSNKADGDVITHLAVCASQDWHRVDSLMVSNFVTASQAHRKWFTKIVKKISHGSYQLGANSANILTIDRRTGEICEEKMQAYVRLGIRLLYQGGNRSRMEGTRIKKMLAAMSVKQGIKYDSPLSKAEIPAFIAFHNLDVSEVREPLDSFTTFNEFFYRRLKADARPLDSPQDPGVLVSAADCRLMAFDSVGAATSIWVKGRDFTIERLLGEEFKGVANEYAEGGGFCIFRLAPQDYHRFHCPADATVGRISKIEGQYYTVNPMAIRSSIDVYGENVREVVEFHSPQFGTFFMVCIGAMMVGSIGLEIKTGDVVKRGDPFGWFAFGGSTLCMVLPPGSCAFDQDLLENSKRALETLVRVGMRLGRATGSAAAAGLQTEGGGTE